MVVVNKGPTGISGVVLGVLLQLVDVNLYPRPGQVRHQTVDVLPRQSQRQTLSATAGRLVIQKGRWRKQRERKIVMIFRKENF